MSKREITIKSVCLRLAQRDLDRASKRLQKLRRNHPICPTCEQALREAQELIDEVWERMEDKRLESLEVNNNDSRFTTR